MFIILHAKRHTNASVRKSHKSTTWLMSKIGVCFWFAWGCLLLSQSGRCTYVHRVLKLKCNFEFEIKDTTGSNTSASYLDLLLSIESDGQLRTSLYDKRDDFNFHITNFPFLSSNIPSSPAYGVFISQLIRYARACSSYECFILRVARLSSKLLGQGYVMERLKSSLRKFFGRYGDLIKHYEVSLSQMLHDILGHDHLQWHPQLLRHYTNLQTYYRTGLYYRFYLNTKFWRFP